MAEEIDLSDVQGMGSIPPQVNPDDVGLNSKSAAMKLIESRAPQTQALAQKYNVSPMSNMPTYNSNLPAPTVRNNQLIMPTTPDIDGIQETPIPTATDLLKNLHNNINSFGIQARVDPFKAAKTQTFSARNPLYQNQFYDRYQDKVKEIGFSPFRDNDAIWNENSSTWDDIKRASGQWMTLTSLSFADAAGLGSLSEQQVAKEQERAFAIGSSSRGGFGGWASNFYLNSGFTVGILAELAVEEIGLLAAEAALGIGTVGSGGLAAPVTVPSMAATGTLMAARFTRAMGKINKAWKTAKNIGQTLDKFKDINQVRKSLSAFGKGTAKFLNPAENVIDFYRNYNRLSDFKNYQKVAKGVGAAYRDYRNLSLAYKEATIEGGSVELEMQRDLYDQFVKDNGRIPTTAEADGLRQKAAESGVLTKMINAPVILLSNKLTFDGLVRPRMGKVASDLIESGLGKKILMNPKAELGKVFSVAPSKWKALSRAKMYYQNPKLLAKGVTTYAEANWAEGLQELAQETIAGASKDYYLNNYAGDATRGGFMAYMDNVGKNLGGEDPFGTFMSGFLMGGAIKPVSNVIAASTGQSPTLNNLYLKFSNKEEYNRIKKNRDAMLAQTVNQLNEVYKDPTKYFSADMENLQSQQQIQQDMIEADKNNDTKTYQDLKDASTVKHVMTALKMNRVDTFIQRMQEQKNLSEAEVQEEYGMSKAEFDKKLDNGIGQAKIIQERYDVATKKFSNPFNPEKYKDKNSPQYMQEAIRKKAWDDAIEQMVTSQYSFDQALARKTSILENLKNVAELDKTAASEFTSLESLSSLEQEIGILTKELDSIKELKTVTDPDLQKVQEYKQQKLDAIKAYRDAVQKNVYEKKDDNEDLSDEEYDEISKAFTQYSKVVSGNAGDFVNISALDKAARNMTDAHFLDQRAKKLNNAVNVLLEPKNFVNQVERFAALGELIHKNRKAEIEKSLQEFLKLKDTNDMLGELASELEEKNMFVDPDDLVELVKTGKVPKQLYYIADQGDIKAKTQVDYRSSDYAKAIETFKNYVEHVHGIQLDESQLNPYLLTTHRAKDANDKRKYADIAEQYGFDPKEASSSVPLVQVLETIMNSEHATENEKALAQSLMEVVDRREKVTFVNNGKQAGKYTKNEQTVIDARYSSSEYGTGQGPAIETSILKQEVLRRTSEALENDTEFNKKITDLMKESAKFFDKLSEQDKIRLFGKEGGTKIPAGFSSPQEFLQSAMNDPQFQQLLGMVKTDMATESGTTPTWVKFVNAVLDAIGKALGGNPSGTVLNATMDLITTTIESKYTAVAPKGKKTTTTKAAATRRGSQYTPAELMAVDNGKLGELVLNEFIADNQRRVDDGNNPLLVGFENMSRQDILNSTAFKNYLKDPNFAKKERIIREYVPETPVTSPAGQAAPAPTATGQPITAEEISLEDVTDTEYDAWVNGGAKVLSQNTIYKLAQKIKNNSLRTQQEDAMLSDTEGTGSTMGKVNDLLREFAAGYPKTPSTAMKNKMKELGYKPKDYRDMSAAMMQETIWEGLTKEEKEQVSTAPTVNQRAQKEVADFNRTMQELFDSITTYDQIIEIRNGKKINKFKNSIIAEYGSLSADAKILLGDTQQLMDKLNEMETEKLKELANSNTFADINVGEVVILNNQYETQATVTNKTADTLTYEFMKADGNTTTPVEVTIKAEDVQEKIKYRSNPALTELESREEEVEITEEDTAQANESTTNLENVASTESINEDVNEAKSKSEEELDDEFLDDIC
jgi:hypothetical protein